MKVELAVTDIGHRLILNKKGGKKKMGFERYKTGMAGMANR